MKLAAYKSAAKYGECVEDLRRNIRGSQRDEGVYKQLGEEVLPFLHGCLRPVRHISTAVWLGTQHGKCAGADTVRF